MILKELMKLLRKIQKAHPEAKEAIVVASSFHDNLEFQVSNVGFSKRYKQGRILLED